MWESEESLNPFPGLRAFEPDEDHLFFGREEQIDELLSRLRRTRFLSVVGTSGSGKSSLIRSGLIPSLYSGFMSRAGSSWRVAVMRPGSDPIGNLAAALNDPEVLGGDPDLADMNLALLQTTLHRSAMGLVETVRQARLSEGENLLVLADQFEELFRFKRNIRIKDSKDAALAFVKLLLEATKQEEVPVYIVLTMRSDFIGSCTEFPGLAEAINDGQYLVPRMTREERKAAIVGPVAVGGAEITPRLVLRLLNEVGDDPDQLPILQHSLMRTWAYWEEHHGDDEPVDLRHYEAIGTMEEALSLHAEEAYQELSSAEEQRIAELMFKALTDTGSDARGVRRPSRLAEICELTDASKEQIIAVIDCFRAPGRSFLMPPVGTPIDADTVIDISHESLMRTWKRLIEWVDEEARSSQVYLQLSKAAALYQEGKTGLFRDPELQIALNWRLKHEPNETWAQRYDPAFERALLFLKYSEKERELEIAEKERQRQRQLQMARRMMMALAAVALVVLVFGMYSLQQKIAADDARQAAIFAQVEAEQQAEEAKRQRVEVEKQKKVVEVERAEAEKQRERAEEEAQRAEEEAQRAEEESLRAQEEERRAEEQATAAEGARLAAVAAQLEAEKAETEAESQREIALAAKDRAEKSEAEAQRLGLLTLSRALAVQTPRLRREDQRELAALLARQSYRLFQRGRGVGDDPDVFDALRGSLQRLQPTEISFLRDHQDAVRSLALLPGDEVLSAGADGTIRRFNPTRSQEGSRVVAQLPTEVRALAVDSETGRLAAGGLDGSIFLGRDGRFQSVQPALPGGGPGVTSLVFIPEVSGLGVSDSSGRVLLYDVGGEKQPDLLGKPVVAVLPAGVAPRRIHALGVDRKGELLAAAAGEAGVLIWDPRRLSEPARVLASSFDARSLAMSHDGRQLAVGSSEGPIRVWDLATSSAKPDHEFLEHRSGIAGLSFGDGSRTLASAGLDGKVMLWDLTLSGDDGGDEPIVLEGNESWVWTVALAAGGDRVISGGADRTVRFWTTRTQVLADQICQQVTTNLSRDQWEEYMPHGMAYEKTCENLQAAD